MNMTLFENKVLRKILGAKSVEVSEGWIRPHNEIHNLYALTDISRVIRSRKMIWAGHVERMR
jgi:hypothetical protein